ncbi:MAG: methyl-accepting chemotaxis protein [Gammaproteobacteria bacterium]|nr:methyl-accepting chemotaxis protein [Gammaproteobacteria bacterium]
MQAHKLVDYAKGRLFQLMIGAMTLGVLTLSAVSIHLTFDGFGSLGQEVSSSLQVGQSKIEQTFDQSLGQISETITETEEYASKSLVGDLTSSMQGELKVTEKVLNDALMETAGALAGMLSAVAPEAILGKKFSTLIGYVKVANVNPRVVYVVYMRPGSNKPFTRYVNRKNPLVKALITKGQGRTPLDKLLSAAARDTSIQQISRPITFEGKELGSVILGVSIEVVNQRVAEMQSRFDNLSSGSGAKVKEALQTVAQAITNELQANFTLVNEQSAESSRAAQTNIDQTAKELLWIQTGTMAAIGLFILAVLCVFFMRRVIYPINLLQATLQDIAAGEGDLTQRLPENGNDEIAKVANAFNMFVSKIQKTLSYTSDVTNDLSSGTDMLAKIAHDNDENVSKQQAETQQVATSITEMAATVKEIAHSTDSAASAARETNNEASQGKMAMDSTVKAIDTLAAEVTEAAEVINKLEADSGAISSVLDVIRGIAEQTNLLALNAAIEAARAGEQGRGFAVVADEVRTLASRTQDSTSEIHNIIENLQNGTRNAVQVMNGGLDTAKQTVETAGRTGSALDNIVQSVSTIMDMNTQIATASEQHTVVAQEIDSSVARISELSEIVAQGSSRTTDNSQKLSALGDKLQSLVKQFKV